MHIANSLASFRARRLRTDPVASLMDRDDDTRGNLPPPLLEEAVQENKYTLNSWGGSSTEKLPPSFHMTGRV